MIEGEASDSVLPVGGSKGTELVQLHDAADRLHSSRTIDDCYGIAIEGAVDVLGFEWCVLATEAPETREFEIEAVSAGAPVDAGDRPFSIDEGIAGHVYRTKESAVVDDIAASDRANPVRDGIRSALTVPVADWGIFQAVSTAPGAYDEGDCQLAELLMTHVSTTVHRIEAEAELRNRKRDLERQNGRLDRVTSIITHDLRSPLNVARGNLELAREERDSPYLEEVARAHDRMDDLIEHMLSWARQGDLVDSVSTVSLERMVRRTWTGLAPDDATIRIETERPIRADEDRVRQLLENVFRNAIEHAGRDCTVIVGDHGDGFFVADDGPGIPADDRADVFEPGYSTDDEGTGIGLAIVSTIVEAHGWEIRVTESDSGGARFLISGVEYAR